MKAAVITSFDQPSRYTNSAPAGAVPALDSRRSASACGRTELGEFARVHRPELDAAAFRRRGTPCPAVAEVEESREHQREAESVAREWQGIAQRAALQAQAGLYSGPQRVTSQRNALTAHQDLLTAQADQAQAWFRLYRSLGGGWNADPSSTDQLAAQP